MQNVVSFIDEVLTRQLATGLIGSEVRLTTRDSVAFGVNFKVLLRKDQGYEQSTTTKTADLLPEQLALAIWDELKDKAVSNLHDDRQRFVAGLDDAFIPGTPVLVTNARFLLDGKQASAPLSGETCIRYQLSAGNGMLHAYTGVSGEALVDSLVGQPVAVAGILRYTPAYSVPGAVSLNLALRVAAIWLA